MRGRGDRKKKEREKQALGTGDHGLHACWYTVNDSRAIPNPADQGLSAGLPGRRPGYFRRQALGFAQQGETRDDGLWDAGREDRFLIRGPAFMQQYHGLLKKATNRKGCEAGCYITVRKYSGAARPEQPVPPVRVSRGHRNDCHVGASRRL